MKPLTTKLKLGLYALSVLAVLWVAYRGLNPSGGKFSESPPFDPQLPVRPETRETMALSPGASPKEPSESIQQTTSRISTTNQKDGLRHPPSLRSSGYSASISGDNLNIDRVVEARFMQGIASKTIDSAPGKGECVRLAIERHEDAYVLGGWISVPASAKWKRRNRRINYVAVLLSKDRDIIATEGLLMEPIRVGPSGTSPTAEEMATIKSLQKTLFGTLYIDKPEKPPCSIVLCKLPKAVEAPSESSITDLIAASNSKEEVVLCAE
jgi:hypothetical protein